MSISLSLHIIHDNNHQSALILFAQSYEKAEKRMRGEITQASTRCVCAQSQLQQSLERQNRLLVSRLHVCACLKGWALPGGRQPVNCPADIEALKGDEDEL